MGNQASSELEQTCRRLEDLKSKPELLKAELRKFVAALPLDHTVDVRVDKKLFDIMMNLVLYELRREGSPDLPVIMQALQRLFRVRGFYLATPRCSVVPLIQSLQMKDPNNVLATLQAIAPMLDCRCPPDGKKFDKAVAEMSAKQAFMESQGYDVLVKRVLIPYGRGSQHAIVAKTLDMLALDLVDNSITTRFVGIQKLLALITPHLDLILHLTTHPDLNTRCYSSILLQGYLLHSPLQITQNLQSKVLEEGHLLHYILFSIDGASLPANHPYTKKLYDINLTELSRNLLGLLCAGNPAIVDVAVHKTIPKPLQLSLDKMGADSASNSSLAGRSKAEKAAIKNSLWANFQSGKMKRVDIHPQFAALDVEVREPHVLWTIGTKAELCMGLLKEIEDLRNQRQINPDSRWDYDGFEISYKSLERYLRVGGYYISLLLPVLHDKNSPYQIELERIHMLLAALFQRSVIEDNPGWKLALLRTMSALYTKFGDQLTKDLEIIPYFSWLVDPRHTGIYRDHVLGMLGTLLKDPANVKRFVRSGGVQHLLYYISRVHAIPDPHAAADAAGKSKLAKKKHKKDVDSDDEEKDSAEEDKPLQPLSPSSGFSGSAEDNDASGKQNLLGGLPLPLGIPEVASLCLGLLKLVQAAGPKMRRVMSEKDVVNTLVRLLMAPVPAVKEEGVRLLLDILDHSAHLVPKLITTGMFSFLVYGLRFGPSPATMELLSKTHMRQDKSYVAGGESALTPFFPRALAEVLKTQGAEAFGQLFESRDGSASNAAAAGTELIWNPQLRKHLLEVMSRRLGSFRSLLEKDPFAEYKFSGTGAEPIRYPSLESDLNMAGVSLRALNDTGGVPDLLSRIEIPDPDELMSELVKSLNARRYAGIDLLTILTAQGILIKRFPALPDVHQYTGFEALFEIMNTHGEQDFPMIQRSVEILHVLLSAKASAPQQKHEDDEDDEEDDEQASSDPNLHAFLSAKGPQVLVKTLEYFASLRVNQVLIQRILIDLLNVVYDLGIKAPEVVARELSSNRKLVRKLVLDFLGNKASQAHPMLSVVTCKACMALSLNDKFQITLVDTGSLLHLVDMACFYRSASNDGDASSGGAAANSKGMDEEKRVRLAASSVLSLLAGYQTASIKPEPNVQVQRVIASLLTDDLVQTLASPSNFVARVSAARPQMQVLFKFVEAELIGVHKSGEWPQKLWPFQPLNFSLKTGGASRARVQQQQQQQFSTPNGHATADDQGDEYEQQQEGDGGEEQQDEGEYEQGQDATVDGDDPYAASAPQQRVLSPGEKMTEKMSDLGNSVEGAFASFSRRAANALTPVRVSIGAKGKQLVSSTKNAVQGVTQSASAQRAGEKVQSGAGKVAAAAAPKIAAVQKAAAPGVAAAKDAARSAQAQVKPALHQAQVQVTKAAEAAAPKIAQAKQAAAPRIAAAGAVVGAAASSAVAAAKNLAQQVQQPAEDEEEEVHDSREFYANARGNLLSPGNVRSPSTQHTPNEPSSDAMSPQLEEYDPAANEQYEQQQQDAEDAATQPLQEEYAQQEEEYAEPQEYAAPPADGYNQQQEQYDDTQQEYIAADGAYASDEAYEQPSESPDQELVVDPQAQMLSPSGRVILSSR